MKLIAAKPWSLVFLVTWCSTLALTAQNDDGPPDFGGPPPFGPGDFGPGGFGPGGPGPGGPTQQKAKIVEKFDKDGDKRLNATERKAAREYLNQQRGGRGGGRGGNRGGGWGPGGFGRSETPAQPGQRLSPADVKVFPDAPFYDPKVLRTLFLDFDDADWEKELADFKNTDVEVPAKLVVDGKTLPDVGVHFRGMSSFMMVSAGRKRSLSLSLDYVNKKQQIGGYNTLHLLNSHEDPTFLRSVLSYQVDRDYLPAPKANFVRVVINGESWGIYVNVQHFNKQFVKEWFGTTKGTRWKVPGSPGGQGSLAYLGENAAAYRQIYEIKGKDDPKAWTDLIQLCKVLNETSADKLEQALAPLLDIDGALKFLALDNALINNDGYWTRTSDYNIYEDVSGRFHVLPQDSNETFVSLGGPESGGGGGRGGPPGRRGGPGGGPMGFGPGMFLAREMFDQADTDGDQKVTKQEFTALADAWFDKLDTGKSGTLNQQEFTAAFTDLIPGGQRGGPGGENPPDGGRRSGGGRRGFGPGMFIAPGLFTAADQNKDGSLTRLEWKSAFQKWFAEWDSDNTGSLTEDKLRAGLATALPRPEFGGGRGGRGGRGGPGGPGFGGPGFGGGPRVEGVKLDPLIAANDPSKPLISKLLAAPALRTRYLAYMRDIAQKWLDWNKLGPVAEEYYSIIADDVRVDTRKLDRTEDFLQGLTTGGTGGFGGQPVGIKSFAEQRRTYLLNYPEIKKLNQ